MRLAPASPRRRRRLAWGVAALGVAGGVAALTVFLPRTARAPQATARPGPTQVYVAPASVPFTGGRAEAARAVARAFVRSAVLRRDLAASYDIVAPSLREGMSREEWATGDIPVVPYPGAATAEVRERLAYSYRDRVALHVYFLPRPGSTAKPAAFTIELQALGTTGGRRWLVSSWVPLGTLNPATPGGRASQGEDSGRGRLGAIWLLVPVGVFGALIGVLVVALAGRTWRDRQRARRIEARL